MSRCERKIVAGVTISSIAASRSMGSVPASRHGLCAGALHPPGSSPSLDRPARFGCPAGLMPRRILLERTAKTQQDHGSAQVDQVFGTYSTRSVTSARTVRTQRSA